MGRSSVGATTSPAAVIAFTLTDASSWWHDINVSPLWQDRIFYILAALYGVVSAIALVPFLLLSLFYFGLPVFCVFFICIRYLLSCLDFTGGMVPFFFRARVLLGFYLISYFGYRSILEIGICCFSVSFKMKAMGFVVLECINFVFV